MGAEQNSTKKVLKSSAKMAVATFSSRILGLVREQVMAATFGASGITDAFTIAYRVPNMLRDLFAEGAFSSAFVPIFTEAKLKNEDEARRLLWSLFVLLGSITLFLSIGIFFFADPIVHFFTNEKFTSDPERLNLTINLVKIMSPFLVFISLAALFMGALNSLKIFFVPSLAPAFFNIVMIASIVSLPALLKDSGIHPVYCLGIGVLVGGFVQMAIQLPILFKQAYGPKGPLTFVNSYTKRIIHRVGIGTIGIAATQINVLINTILATGTVIGAVSWLTYAFRLFQFPVGILSVSIAGSNLVHFSDAWKSGEKERAVNLLSTSYFLSFLVIAPAFALLFAMGEATVHLVFERGAFDATDSAMTGIALKYYLFGLPFYGLYKIFAPTFFTLDRPKIPVFISVGSIIFNIVFCVSLVPIYGFKILALGTSVSMFLNSTAQSIFLRKYLELPGSFFFNRRVGKTIIGGALCYLTASYLVSVLPLTTGAFYSKISYFCLTGLAGAATYFLVMAIFGELNPILRLIKRR
ncbi:MAG: murein biosynthesis integral membrane protein MurJ [Halobacteriovorax sp.]|nr:murein biosynthesis integral membrane protein MurJ [Halobacteriovorax sp.]